MPDPRPTRHRRRRDLELTAAEQAQMQQLEETTEAALDTAKAMQDPRRALAAIRRFRVESGLITAAAHRRQTAERIEAAREHQARAQREEQARALRGFAQPLDGAAGSPTAPYRSPTSVVLSQVAAPASDGRSEGRSRDALSSARHGMRPRT